MRREQKSSVLRVVICVAVLTLLGFTSAPRGMAEAARGRSEGHEAPHWAGHPVEHRGERPVERWGRGDLPRWRAGHWFHGEHLGRLGWWWIVDGTWFFYPAPLYPYPDPYVPPAMVAQAPGYWYYCRSLNAYYPYVTACPEGWQPVAPTPAS